MSAVLRGVEADWRRLVRSAEACRALMRWSASFAVFVGVADLEDVLARRKKPEQAQEILAALAALSPTDETARRVLLQALVPGLLRLATTVGYGDRDTLNDIMSLAWERIATYPSTRHGDVAANVLLDVRKRYQQLREIEQPRKRHHRDPVTDHQAPASDDTIAEQLAPVPSAEDEAMQYVALGELVAAQRDGVISKQALRVIVQTRVLERTVAEVAGQSGTSRNTVVSWRFRAERRLREVLLAG
jgi:hypothetical protein